MNEKPKALKSHFDRSLLTRMATALHHAYPPFCKAEFISLDEKLRNLEMKDRVRLIRDELYRQLPANYTRAIGLLRKSLLSKKLHGFDLWPYTEFVQTYGLENVDLSLNVLKDFTRLFTAEWAVRPFLRLEPEKTRTFLIKCSEDPDVHIRRWASEGSRPRLPWGEQLRDVIADPLLNLSLLEKLKFDSELYVRKSVANHLNDISKDHPEWVCRLLKRWNKETPTNNKKNMTWLTRHALRSLIKQGHPQALQLIGVKGPARIRLDLFRLNAKNVHLGEDLSFEIQIRSLSDLSQAIVIDYILHFRRANGKTSAKVFKLRSLSLPPLETMRFEKRHPVKKITTRSYYPGLQCLEIQINGIPLGRRNWRLI